METTTIGRTPHKEVGTRERRTSVSGMARSTWKILNLLPRGKYSIIEISSSTGHYHIQCYVEDDLVMFDICKPMEN